jgi:hypothetical protein
MGLRAGPLSDAQVIDRISTMFIPVAVNLYEIREDKGPGGKLFLSVQKQMDQYQGFWLVTPDGRALAKKHDWLESDPAKRPGELVRAMDDVLNAVGNVKPRPVKPVNLFPHRGTGVQVDGSVNIALYGRLMHQGKPDGPMMLDSMTMGAAEWAHFAPPGPNYGVAREWTVPESVARKLARSLSPGDSSGVCPPEDFREAELRAKVESIEGASARIRLTGKWQAEGLYGGEADKPYHASATADGIAVYDVEKKSMRSLLLVFKGRVWSGRSSPGAAETGRETGGVAEWTNAHITNTPSLPGSR